MNTNHTRKHLQIQGFDLDDEALAEIGPWMLATGAAFYVGAATVGYVLGGLLVPIAILVATTHVCIPSMVYNALFERKQSQSP